MNIKIEDYKNKELPKEVRIESLRQEIQKGVDAMRAGNYKTYHSADEMIEDVIKEVRAEFNARKINSK